MFESSESGDNVIPLNEETQIALPSNENERRLAVPVTIPSFNLNKGTFQKPNFGPQTNTKHVEANTIEHATITHVHHHYGGDDKSQESPTTSGQSTSASSTSGASATSPKQELEEGFVQITDDIFMNTNKPLKEGLKIYDGYQEHVTGQRQPLAIKVIFPCTKKSIREVQHLVTLTPHPNVVRIIRSKEHKAHLPTLYIAMELCGSKNLHDYLNENREKSTPFDFKKTMFYSKRLVKAMKHIHRNRIIHGDLKPENILFSLDGDQIKVSDFGISKELRKSRSSTKLTSQGTDGYRAPETYSSDIISMKADIFSLGVTLYCLWTNGKHPFGPNPYRWVVNIMDNTGRDLSGLPEEMGAQKHEFLDLLNKILQVDPEKRPTIEEILQHPFFSSSQATSQTTTHDPDHLHRRMTTSSDRRDDDLWRKKLRVTNIPSHLYSYEALRGHFERFGKLEECRRKGERTFSRITFHNHRDALAAKYGAVSTGPEQNLVIIWDDIEDPAVNVADSYPSSEILNAIVVRSETLRKMQNLGMDVDKLNVWRVIRESGGDTTTSVIHSMDRGRLIGSFTETRFRSEKFKINGEERLISELGRIKLPVYSWRDPGICVWFDHVTLQLFVNNLASYRANFRITSNLDPKSHFSLLPEKISVPIFSIKKYVDWIERKKREGGQVTGEEGVEISLQAHCSPHFTILIIPEGILQSR